MAQLLPSDMLPKNNEQTNQHVGARERQREKMREEERRVKQETAWPMQLPAATGDPGGTTGPSEGCSQDRPSDLLHPRSPL